MSQPYPVRSTAQRRIAIGRYGEERAARFLTEHGMDLLDRNWSCTHGELDLVLFDGDNNTVVFCEVKTRTSDIGGTPIEAVTPDKLTRIRRCAAAWMHTHELSASELRVDVISVTCPQRGAPVIEHTEGVG